MGLEAPTQPTKIESNEEFDAAIYYYNLNKKYKDVDITAKDASEDAKKGKPVFEAMKKLLDGVGIGRLIQFTASKGEYWAGILGLVGVEYMRKAPSKEILMCTGVAFAGTIGFAMFSGYSRSCPGSEKTDTDSIMDALACSTKHLVGAVLALGLYQGFYKKAWGRWAMQGMSMVGFATAYVAFIKAKPKTL
jgi:hypothetical protein